MDQQTPIVQEMASRFIPFDMELDKIPGFWVVTGWLDPVVLRIRVHHIRSDEPCYISCEIRLDGAAEFVVLSTFIMSVWGLVHETSDSALVDFPSTWHWEFVQMARRWAACAWIVELGNSAAARYGAEPRSSRDYFMDGE